MRLALLLTSLALIAAAPVPRQAAEPFEAMRAADLRLASIAYRLTTANRALCGAVVPTPGLAIHAIDQYDPRLREGLRSIFSFETPVAIEAVVPGSAAALAGVVQNDSLVTVASSPVVRASEDAARPSSGTRDAASDLIARQPAEAPLALELMRNGVRRTVRVPASPGCASRFEVLVGRGLIASADGTVVQIGMRFLERFDDAQIAVVVAHELSHNILRHRLRLEAAGVKRGLLAEVGRNGRLFRQTENDADLLGVHLLRNAGYDPESAVRFWRDHGEEVGGGFFRSRTHFSAGNRAKAIAAEIRAIPAGAPIPYRPPVLATRDQPLG